MMGGLGAVIEDSWLQKVGMDPRICTNEENVPSPKPSTCTICSTCRQVTTAALVSFMI
jgi:hypothetical protein